MKLSPLQHRALNNYWGYHTRGWSAGYTLELMGWRWLLVAVYGLIGGFILWFILPWASGLVAGMCCGAILRDLGTLRRAYQIWPLTDEIINWDRVEELMALQEIGRKPNT